MILYNHPISASGSIVLSGYSNDGHCCATRFVDGNGDVGEWLVAICVGHQLIFYRQTQSQLLGASRWIDPLGLAPPSLSVIMPS